MFAQPGYLASCMTRREQKHLNTMIEVETLAITLHVDVYVKPS